MGFEKIEATDLQLARYLRDEARIYFVALDSRGRVIDASRHAREVSGSDMMGKKFSELVVDFTNLVDLSQLSGSDSQIYPLSLNRVVVDGDKIRSGAPLTYQFRFIRSGEQLLALGEPSIEEQELLQRNLLEINSELNNITRRYQKANAELTKLNEQKNQFLGMAAHDLRSPLASIISYCDCLLEELGAKDQETTKFLGVIKKLSSQMLSMLEELLSLTRVESGRLNLELLEFDLQGLVAANLEINSKMAAKKELHLTLHCHEQLPKITADPNKIEQVLNNLLTNAIKFSHPGQKIVVELFLSGEYATVAVKDEGIGIPVADQDRLFQPFVRLVAKGTAGETTTGLGLAIVRNIVTGHGGRIWVESGEGQGATFYFTLPLRRLSPTAHQGQNPLL